MRENTMNENADGIEIRVDAAGEPEMPAFLDRSKEAVPASDAAPVKTQHGGQGDRAAYRLRMEMEAAKALVQSLGDMLKTTDAETGETRTDDELLLDTIEGETDLLEKIEAVLLSIKFDEAQADGLKGVIAVMSDRMDRFKKRAERKKAVVQVAFQIAEIRKHEFPIATVYTSKVADKLVIEQEAEIPADYWKTGDPKLDRKAVTDALKANRAARDEAMKIEDRQARDEALDKADEDFPPVPGATLSNGGEIVKVNWK